MRMKSRAFKMRLVVQCCMVMLLMLGIGGCGAPSDSATPPLVYPESPGEFPMYDVPNINNEAAWTTVNTHDPGIIKTDKGYYVFSTDIKVGGEPRAGVMVRRSDDLIHWKWVDYALPGVPQEAKTWTNATHLWAPDIVKYKDQYRLYYSASTFGSRQSMIGLVTSPSIEGPWEEQGNVIRTKGTDGLNAIDANVVTDAQGKMWMVYGSFFDGIHIIELDPESGKPKQQGFGTKIAARSKAVNNGAVEGPYIVYNNKFNKYYLFVSYDSLFENYNVRVGRADAITGPYLDFNGRNMLDTEYEPQYEVGTKLLGGYRFGDDEGWIAPGHNSVLNDDGQYYIAHHARGEADKNWAYLHIRKILWSEEGWPLVSPERYAGEKEQDVPKAEVVGKWQRIVQDPFLDGQAESDELELLKDGTFTGVHGTGVWTLQENKRTLQLTWNSLSQGEGKVETVALSPAWDWEKNVPCLVFTGLNEQGISIWGKKISSN